MPQAVSAFYRQLMQLLNPPRLMFVNRCKGLCSSDAIGRVACVPTKRSWKKVNMQLKTQVIGREMREKFKELVLEEHEECACQCLTVSPKHCLRPELFNNETCSCACDNSLYRYVQDVIVFAKIYTTPRP